MLETKKQIRQIIASDNFSSVVDADIYTYQYIDFY